MITVFIVISNNGDGSNSLHYFDGRCTSIEGLLDLDKHDPETWGSGDGVQVTWVRFPDCTKFKLANIDFTNIEDIYGLEKF